MNTFFELIQIAIGKRESLTRVPQNREEWDELLKIAGQHNLLAFTFPVIDRLHDEVDVPLGVYSRWAMTAEKVAAKGNFQKDACVRLYKGFLEHGFRSCILKGQAAGALYPDPSLRQGGDIDIWVEGDRKEIVDFLRSRFEVHKVVYHHCDVNMIKGVSVEVHFTPTWMNAPLSNRRLQRWIAAQEPAQFSNFDPNLGFNVPTLEFDAVYMLLHIYRHVLEEGIGLRQLLDYYYVLQHLDGDGRRAVMEHLGTLRLGKFAAAVMYVLQKVFLMDDSRLLCPPHEREGAFLLEEIMLSGNFGKFDSRNAHEKGEGLVKHSKRKLTRGLRYLLHYPSEVLGMPVFMCWQYFWRRKNGFLYKGR
ncbi:MAG: nucleotidyltransferase family protein [Bacteroidales bacterium]|nr:nucleotidyltransferase family protein [Bacteroidales bacterium]